VYTLRAQQKGKPNTPGAKKSTIKTTELEGRSSASKEVYSTHSSLASSHESDDSEYQSADSLLAQSLVLFKEMAATLQAIEKNTARAPSVSSSSSPVVEPAQK
jgi:hypothetical protein